MKMGMSNPSPSTFVGESLSWDLSFFNNYNNEDEETEILTALVRTSYLNYLQRSLIRNYEHWLDSNKDSDDFDCSREDILKCANFLEHKALRACMIASYYQRAMVKTMKEIKRSTEEGSLFSPLIEHVFDSKIKNCCEKGTQTSISLTNCKVESPELSQDTLQTKQTKETSTIDITLENSNLIIFNPYTTDNSEKDKGTNNDLEDLFNILMTSPNYSDKNDNDSIPISKKRKYDETTADNISLKNIIESNDSEFPSEAYLNDKTHISNLDERLQKFAALFGEDESNSKVHEIVENEHGNKDINPTNDNTFSTNDNMEENTIFRLALDWKSEFAAQNCNLKCILARLSPTQKIKVQRKFKEIFGIDKPLNVEISLTEAALSRKRTANIVVGALTPHYLGGKIASRNVFKSLAKKVTDDVLLITNIADIEEVTSKVNIYFENGRCINSEKDIMSV